jgi:PTS system ascorbate-specific IIA component
LKAVGAHIDPERSASIDVCDVGPGQSLDDVVAKCASILEGFGDCDTLILTDVYGATPCNAALRLGQRGRTRVIAGVNVPALWRALGHLDDPLDTIVELAVTGGQLGVMQVTAAGLGTTVTDSRRP